MNICFFVAIALAVAGMTSPFQLAAQPIHEPEKLIAVALQPQAIVPHGDRVHVFCNQVDINFDGIKDVGDVPGSWLILSALTGEILQSTILEWGGISSQRPALSASTNRLYISNNGRVRVFDATTQEVLVDTLYPYDSPGLGVNSAGSFLTIARRPNFTNPGYVVYLNIENGDTTVQLPSGINVQQALFYQTSDNATGLVVLNEGNFGKSTSTLEIWTLTSQETSVDTVKLGDTGNHMFVEGDTVYVTVNGTSNVQIIDLKTLSRDSIVVPTAQFQGPRDAVKIGDDLFVSTFEGKVLHYSLSNKTLKNTLMTNGIPEGLAIVGEKLWVANAFKSDGLFTSDNTIAIWDYKTSTSVGEKTNNGATARIFPTPSAGIIHFEFTGIHLSAQLSIHSLNGETVYSTLTSPNSFGKAEAAFDASSVPAGIYFASLNTGIDMRIYAFTVAGQ